MKQTSQRDIDPPRTGRDSITCHEESSEPVKRRLTLKKDCLNRKSFNFSKSLRKSSHQEDKIAFYNPQENFKNDRYIILDLFTLIHSKEDAEKYTGILLSKFGSAADVIAAEHHELHSAGATDLIVSLLSKIHEAARSFTRAKLQESSILDSDAKLQTYLSTILSREPIENFHVIYLDVRGRLMNEFTLNRGSENHVSVYISEILRHAIQLRSSQFIVAHNHPSGDFRPSQCDLDLTKKLILASRIFDKELADHYIVSSGGIISLRSLEPFGELWPAHAKYRQTPKRK